MSADLIRGGNIGSKVCAMESEMSEMTHRGMGSWQQRGDKTDKVGNMRLTNAFGRLATTAFAE